MVDEINERQMEYAGTDPAGPRSVGVDPNPIPGDPDDSQAGQRDGGVPSAAERKEKIRGLRAERDRLLATLSESNSHDVDGKLIDLDEQIASLESDAGYERAVVTFIDILGFRNLVARRDPKTIFNIVRSFTNRGQPVTARDWLHQKEHDIRVYHFSDTIVRVTPLLHPKTGEPQGALFSEATALAFIQSYLIEEEVVIRGGMTIGDVFATEDMLFGPAMVRAYDLESRIASYPRVVVDPVLINSVLEDGKLVRHNRVPEQEVEWVSGVIDVDFDGIPFVDYINPLPGLKYPGPAQMAIDVHKQLVERELASAKGLDSVSAKYNWMAQYHNRKMREVGGEHGIYDRYLIDLKGMKSTFEKPAEQQYMD